MSIGTSLFSGGWVCPPGVGGGAVIVFNTVDPIVGVITLPAPIGNGVDALTEVNHVFGTSENYPLSFFENDGVTDLDITDGIIEIWVFGSEKDRLSAPFMVHRSYFAEQVTIPFPTVTPQALWKVTTGDARFDIGCYNWCAKLSLKGASKTSAGTLTVETGSGRLVGAGLAIALIEDGDYMVPAGTGPNNIIPVVVTRELDAAGVPTGNLLTDYTDWIDQAGMSFEVFVADNSRALGHSGDFNLLGC